jgi:hypothetical protein
MIIYFMKVWWGEIFIEFMIFNKTIDFYKSLVRWNIYRIYDKTIDFYKSYESYD